MKRLLTLAVFALPVVVSSPASASVLLPAVDWTREGGQGGMSFAQCVAPAGDVDKDGYSDLVVGAPTYTGATTECGLALLYRGGAAGPAAAPLWQFEGTQAGAATGTSVAPAGDVNGDGYADIIVGAPLFNVGGVGLDAGRVYVFFGSATGPALAPSQTFNGTSANARFGFSVANAGDIDADGYADVLIGAPGHTDQNAGEGAAYLYRGSAAGLVATTWLELGGDIDVALGYAVSGAGDVDADGFDDVIVGAPGRSFNFTNEGFAYVYRGSGTGLAATPAANLPGVSDSSAFGAAVARAGDVNGDGYADVIIGAPNASVGLDVLGYAVVYLGAPGGIGGSWWEQLGQELRENFGVSVGTAGDLNGDDLADFYVGADQWPHPSDRVGRVSVFLGAATFPVFDTDLFGTTHAEAFAFSAATAGDLDGDGFSDFVVGRPGAGLAGALSLWRGSASKPVPGLFWPQLESEPSALFGFGIAGGVDERWWGVDNLFVSAPLADQGFLDAGKIRVATAQIPSPVLNAGFVASGERAGMRFGTEMARAGDVDGDFHEDLLVGSPNYTNGQGNEGLAAVYRGTASGLAATPFWRYETNVLGDQVGRSVAAGDFNADGYADILVGTLSGSIAGLDGRAMAFHGSPAGPSLTPTRTLFQPPADTWFGFRVAVGDWDCDGYSDAAVGAPNETNGQAAEGRVHVYFGGPAGLELSPTWILEANVPNSSFGYGLANAGDVDGDGVGDILVGAPFAFSIGRAYVFRGSRSRSTPGPPRRLAPDVSTITFGLVVAGIGDVDKDGRADMLVGAPQHSNGQVNEGCAWLFRGSRLGGELVPWWRVESDVAEARYGAALARIGDPNADGWPDFAVGAPYQPAGGALYVYHSGGHGRLMHSTSQEFPAPPPNNVWMGGRLPGGGTTLAGLATLRSPAGRVRGRIELQVGTQHEAWSGGQRVLQPTGDTGAPTSFGSMVLSYFTYPGLGPGVAWRWRNRMTVPGSPYFPHSPWREPRAFETAEPHFFSGGTNVAVEPGGPLDGSRAVRFTAVEPSPSRGDTHVRFRLARAGEVGLALYDARGRLVRTLARGTHEAGDRAIVFDGRDDAGRPIAAGIYFLALDGLGERDVRKLVRLP